MCFRTTCTPLACGLIHSPSDSALVHQLALRNAATDPRCGGWTLDSSSAWSCLFVIPQCTGKAGTGGAVGLFRRTTAGIFQPNGHVFTLGFVLISHCNENNTRGGSLWFFSQGSLCSRDSNADTITPQISQILNLFLTGSYCSSLLFIRFALLHLHLWL